VERLVLQASRESQPRALPAEPEARAAVLTPLLGWFPSAQRQAEVQLDEAELLRQVEQASLPASLPAESRAEPAAESPKAQAAWSAA